MRCGYRLTGLIEHDRATAFQAFDAALALSPSSALTYICGSTLFAWAGEAQRAIDWGERAVRLSPFDPLGFIALTGISLGHFMRGSNARPPTPRARRSRSIPCSASTTCVWWRRLPGWGKPR